jgi:hypothetical protein
VRPNTPIYKIFRQDIERETLSKPQLACLKLVVVVHLYIKFEALQAVKEIRVTCQHQMFSPLSHGSALKNSILVIS